VGSNTGSGYEASIQNPFSVSDNTQRYSNRTVGEPHRFLSEHAVLIRTKTQLKMTTSRTKTLGILLAVFVVAISMVGTPAMAAHNTDDVNSGTLADGDLVWEGQTLLYQDASYSDTTAELRTVEDGSSGDLVSELTVDADGHIVVDTADLNGQYQIELDNGTNTDTVQFEVSEQSLTASPAEDEDAEVTNSENGNDAISGIDIESNRASYPIKISSADLSDDDLAQVISATGSVNDDSEYVLASDVSDGTFNFNFQNLDAGDYSFTVEGTATGVSDTFTVTVNEASDVDANFDASTYNEDVGETAEFTVELDSTSSADVVLGDEADMGYQLDMTVNDNDDDGEVTVEFNSFLAGEDTTNTDVVSIADEDSDDTVTINSETNGLSDKLASGSYSLTTVVEGEDSDVSILALDQINDGSASTHVLPASADSDEAEDFKNAEVADAVADGDQAVVAFDLEGTEGYLSDSTTAMDFDGDEDTPGIEGLTLTLEQSDSAMNQDPAQVDLSNVKYVDASDDDRLYFVVDTAALGGNFETDDTINANLDVYEKNPYVEDEDAEYTLSSSFDLVESDVDYDAEENDDGDLVFERSNEGQLTISGETDLADGTEANVEARSDSTPFFQSESVEVDNGTFSMTFDVSEDAVDADDFAVKFGSLEAQDAVVTQAEPPTPATFEVSDLTPGDVSTTTDDAGVVNVEAVVANTGEVAGEQSVELRVDEEAVSSENISLDAGEDATVEFEFDASEYDAGEYAYGVYSDDGDASATLTIDSVEDTPSDDSESDDSSSDDSDADSDDSSSDDSSSGDSESTESTDDSTPGFGAVVALTALVASALVAARRRD